MKNKEQLLAELNALSERNNQSFKIITICPGVYTVKSSKDKTIGRCEKDELAPFLKGMIEALKLQNKLLDDIAFKLDGIDYEDLSTAERQILDMTTKYGVGF